MLCMCCSIHRVQYAERTKQRGLRRQGSGHQHLVRGATCCMDGSETLRGAVILPRRPIERHLQHTGGNQGYYRWGVYVHVDDGCCRTSLWCLPGSHVACDQLQHAGMYTAELLPPALLVQFGQELRAGDGGLLQGLGPQGLQ
jgi:hypothetical protein